MATEGKDMENAVMVVDDEPDMLSMLRLVIEKKCRCPVVTAVSGRAALEELDSVLPAVVVTDIKMPDLGGLELQKEIKKRDPTISVVIMTGYGTIDMAVQALKEGAYDFLEKPFDKDHIVRVIANCLERTALLRTNLHLQEKLESLALPEGFIGQSPALNKALDLIARVADTDATVLIRGESGTGKEMAAKALHSLSRRKQRRMITVNCPALPENVLESELFGYSKGAFTGADHEKKGLFLEAHGSTILLDEIGDIPPALQTKLLRVLQEKEIQPLGQNKTIKVDVRVVASTNQDLEAKIAGGEFREDLFYRLNVVTVVMPGLRDMKEDIPLLVHHFLDTFKKRYQRPNVVLSPDILQYLYQREWQGNVRQLQNTIKRLVLLAAEGTISLADLEGAGNDGDRGSGGGETMRRDDGFRDLYSVNFNEAKATVLQRFTRGYVTNLLTAHEGNVTNAASACGLERQALQRIMRRYGIVSSTFKQQSGKKNR